VILHPAVIALVVSDLVTAALLLYGAGIGIRVLRGWNPASGSEEQLLLERQAPLVSAIVATLLAVQILSLFLFIRTADTLHPLFTGAMCAAGTLNLNAYGYPALLLKLVNTMAAGVWLLLNHADSRGHDFPLVRPKFATFLPLAPLACLEAFLLTAFVSGLGTDVITSCCGSLFGGDQGTFAGGIAGLPPRPTGIAFYAVTVFTLAAGVSVLVRGRGGLLLAVGSLATVVVGMAGLISLFALYYYEIPGHHCPFCLLQQEYHSIGYLLYLLLLGGGICGIGAGVLQPAARKASLARLVPAMQRRLAVAAMAAFAGYALLVTWRMATSSFRLS
jgi:hypothetical protein